MFPHCGRNFSRIVSHKPISALALLVQKLCFCELSAEVSEFHSAGTHFIVELATEAAELSLNDKS